MGSSVADILYANFFLLRYMLLSIYFNIDNIQLQKIFFSLLLFKKRKDKSPNMVVGVQLI